MTRYLVDSNVLQRLPRSSQIRAAVTDVLDAEDELCSCGPTLDEFAYSARSPTEHAESVRRLRRSFLYLPLSPAIDQIIIDIRTALFAAGKRASRRSHRRPDRRHRRAPPRHRAALRRRL